MSHPMVDVRAGPEMSIRDESPVKQGNLDPGGSEWTRCRRLVAQGVAGSKSCQPDRKSRAAGGPAAGLRRSPTSDGLLTYGREIRPLGSLIPPAQVPPRHQAGAPFAAAFSFPLSAALTLFVSGVALTVLLATTTVAASAAPPPVGLGTAGSFAVLAAERVTNTGPTVITGDLGLSPGSEVTGAPLVNGAQHVADAVAVQAQNDLTTAYNDAAGRTPVTDKTDQDLGDQTLVAGVYKANVAMALTGTLTLDAENDPDAVFIFLAGSTLITASNSTVAMIRGANPCNVYWKVGSSATLGTGTTFVGT